MVSAGGIGENEALLWVVMITSAGNRPWPGDLSLAAGYAGAGLPAPSIIRPCKIATIVARHAERLERIQPAMMAEVGAALRGMLGGRV